MLKHCTQWRHVALLCKYKNVWAAFPTAQLIVQSTEQEAKDFGC